MPGRGVLRFGVLFLLSGIISITALRFDRIIEYDNVKYVVDDVTIIDTIAPSDSEECARRCAVEDTCIMFFTVTEDRTCQLRNTFAMSASGLTNSVGARVFKLGQRGGLSQNVGLASELDCPTTGGWVFDNTHSVCYQIVDEYRDWYEANDACTAMSTGGLISSLLVLETRERWTIFSNITENAGFFSRNVWVGFRNTEVEGELQWTDGKLVDHTSVPWTIDAFALKEQDVNCGLIYKGQGKGYYCDSVCIFMCELSLPVVG